MQKPHIEIEIDHDAQKTTIRREHIKHVIMKVLTKPELHVFIMAHYHDIQGRKEDGDPFK